MPAPPRRGRASPLRRVGAALAAGLGRLRHVRRGDAARDRGEWPRAREAYRRALDREPRLAAIWVQYGHALKECGDRLAAEAAYRRGLELGADAADTHLQLGHVLKLLGRPDEALAAYAQAAALAPASDDAPREIEALRAALEARQTAALLALAEARR